VEQELVTTDYYELFDYRTPVLKADRNCTCTTTVVVGITSPITKGQLLYHNLLKDSTRNLIFYTVFIIDAYTAYCIHFIFFNPLECIFRCCGLHTAQRTKSAFRKDLSTEK
jgi:hypothetical protein